MKKALITLLAVACCLTLATAVLAGDEKGKMEGKGKQMSHDEMMAMWMKIATPGEHHNYLKPLAGSWTTVVKSWEGPGEPKVSQGTCETTWTLGDRYIKEECTGSFDGQQFQGMGLTGYDNVQKKYVSTWVDNFGTGIMTSEGSVDPTKKIFTFMGKMPDPMNPASGKMVSAKMVTRIIDDNKHVFSFYEKQEGKDHLSMEITYTRK